MKAKMLNSRKLFVIIALICLTVCIASVMLLRADAAELEGKTFGSSDLYKLNGQIAPDGPITFEAEIYIPEAYRNTRGVLISSYNGGSYLGGFAFEIGSSAGASANGKIRVFSQKYGDVVIDHKVTDYMGTDEDPKFVKIAVTVDTTETADNIILYVNGEYKAKASNPSVVSTMYNSTQTIGGATQTNLLSIGNDERLSIPFKGTMKSVAMYKGVRNAATIAADHAADFYDTADENLIFALDGTLSDGRYIEDRSSNNNHAINKNYNGGKGKSFASTASTELYRMGKNITPGGPITFEAEIYVPVAQRSLRTGAIISNYDNGASSKSWAFEIMENGNVRLFTQTNGQINPIKHSVTQYMGNDDANPVYAKIAVTVDTASGEANLYVNGIWRASGNFDAPDKLAADMYNTATKLWIGGDGRPNNAQNFKGSIRSVAMYSGIRTEAEILLDYARAFYDTTDQDLIFAHDLTSAYDGFIEDKSVNKNHANNTKWTTAEGRAFSSDDEPLYSAKDYTEAPLTYEALIYAPVASTRPGVLWGNYPNGNGNCVNFEIYTNGFPSLWIYENNELKTNYKFNYDVRRNAWVHLVITQETVNNKDTVFKCYVNGELVDTHTQQNYVYKLDMNELQAIGPISIGRDTRADQVFEGRIKNVAIHNKPLTAEEVKNSYENGATVNSSSFIAYYDMTGDQSTSKKITDASGNGYDMQSLFYEKDFTTEDYDYSFAVVGDTQFMVYQDAINGTDYTEYIYDWIVDNYGAKKMQYVFGLGDIIDNGKWPTGTELAGQSSAAAEWAYAKELIVSTLGANNIPYSVIGGNHDYMRPWDTGFNATFGSEPTLTGNITGYYNGTDVYNYYMNFEVEGTPYMLLALEYGANDDILAWANEVVSQNKHRRVIVTTHGYMNYDGTTLDGDDNAAPKPTGTTNEQYLKYNNGDEIWDKFVRKHANIALVLSGHIDYNNIVMREDIGDHGNTVHQFLIDPQRMDRAYGFKTGMVAMLYFRNGGKDVSVEYVSTYRTAENEGKEVLFNGRNQFDFTIEEAPKQASRGEINVWLIGGQSNAVGYANGLAPSQISDSRYTNGFDNVLYYGYGEKWQTSFAPVKLGYGNTASAQGAELGIAAALGNTGEMNAIIKYAQGATALYPVTDSSAAINYGTWTSPSYIADNNVSTDDNKTGDLYVSFINTVESAVAELRRMGYTPVIKGMWWMQGEEEISNGGGDCYKELLTYLTADVREDLTAILDEDMSKMPFVIGKIYTERLPDLAEAIGKVQSEQNSYVASDPYSAIVNPEECADYALQDNFHYNAATQSYLGKSFVDKANAINGEYIVETVGRNINAVGGGLYKKGESVSIAFNINDSYELRSLTVKVGSANAVSIMDALNDMKYSFVCEDNTTFNAVAVSSLDVETNYGTIPKDEVSEEDYPVVLFTNEKDYIGAYASVTEAVNVAMRAPSENYVILLRRDLVQPDGASVSYLTGSITLDLGGHTLTKAGVSYIFDCFYNGGSFTGGNIAIKNGKLVNNEWSALMCFNYGTALSGDITFDFEFENVRFVSEKAGNTVVETWEDGAGVTSSTITANMVFNDCIFDYTGSHGNEKMFNLQARSGSGAVFNVTINGGEIISDRTIGIAELATKDNGDTISFGKGDNGYTVCTIVGDAAITGEQFDSTSGAKLSYSFGTGVTDGTSYTLGEDTVTEYGTIPFKYNDTEVYPFAVFLNGKFIHASSYFGRDNAESALSNGKVNGIVILMRRSFTYKESQYNNLSQTHSITIDLGGYTFTSTDRRVFFAQKKTENETSITVKNGTFVLGSNPLMTFSSWDPDDTADGGKEGWGNYSGGYGFNFVFENINITLTNGASAASIIANHSFTSIKPEMLANLTFNNCNFDLKGSANASVLMFDLSDTHCTVKAVINGGRIFTNGIDFVKLDGGNDDSSFTFGKYNGSYTVLSLKSGINAPEDTLTTSEGVECIFVKASEADGYANYSLYPKVMLGYEVKTSVTLYSNFAYNIYIPKANVSGFTVNGSTVSYREVEIDGTIYYHTVVNIPVGESLRDISLKVALNSGETTVNASWTLSIFNYAKAVLAGSYDDVMKDLVKDMLVYASAAHTYFKNTEDVSAKLSEIGELLADYSADLPIGEVKNPKDDTYFTDVAIYLGEVPSFRFYLADGYTADDFIFKVGSRSVSVIKGNGYVEIVMYAYMMLDNVTFNVKGTDVTESYNLYSYYEYAKTLGNADLIAIVEGLIKYSAAAKAYRNSVMNNS